MKKLYTLLVVLCWMTVRVGAQDSTGQKFDGSRIQAVKIAFITRELNLTTEEAQRFWPVYNDYEKEMRAVMEDKNLTPLERDEKNLNIRKKYDTEFKRVLPQEKVNRYFGVERKFALLVQHAIMERRQMRTQQQMPKRQFR